MKETIPLSVSASSRQRSSIRIHRKHWFHLWHNWSNSSLGTPLGNFQIMKAKKQNTKIYYVREE